MFKGVNRGTQFGGLTADVHILSNFPPYFSTMAPMVGNRDGVQGAACLRQLVLLRVHVLEDNQGSIPEIPLGFLLIMCIYTFAMA